MGASSQSHHALSKNQGKSHTFIYKNTLAAQKQSAMPTLHCSSTLNAVYVHSLNN